MWWYSVKGADLVRPKKYLAIEWRDLVLLRPQIEWPFGLYPEREDDWRKDTFRITFVEGTGRAVFHAGADVPEVDPVLDLDHREFPKYDAKGDGLKHVFSRCRESDGSEIVYIGREALRRIVGAMGVKREELELRLVDLDDARVMVALSGQVVRAIASVSTREEVLRE